MHRSRRRSVENSSEPESTVYSGWCAAQFSGALRHAIVTVLLDTGFKGLNARFSRVSGVVE